MDGPLVPKCLRAGRFFGGCKFEPRYDTIPSGEINVKGSSRAATDLIQAAARRIYVRDVCTRCGHTIEREAA